MLGEILAGVITEKSVGAYSKPMGQWPAFWHNQTAMWEQIEMLADRLDGNWCVCFHQQLHP
jgi:hypothetical protein